MAVQISINTEAASTIVGNVQTQIEQIQDAMTKLDTEVKKLLTDADWKGAAADKFFEVYDSVSDTFTVKVPEDLTTLKENINTNLTNLIEADDAGTR
jgi:Uncharacterized protein conserved in bacteria